MGTPGCVGCGMAVLLGGRESECTEVVYALLFHSTLHSLWMAGQC